MVSDIALVDGASEVAGDVVASSLLVLASVVAIVVELVSVVDIGASV